MKLKLISILLLLFFESVYSQTDWKKIQADLGVKLQKKEISDKDWFLYSQKEAGYISKHYSLMVDSIEPIKSKDKNKQIKLYFPEDFHIQYPNGNQSAKVFLENNTEKIIQISQHDQAVEIFQNIS